jgi:hydroxyacylglutathione hydrolase
MLTRSEVFPHVIEINEQARRRLGCCVYLIFDELDWMLIDIGYEDSVSEIIEMVRQLDFPLDHCKYLVATHADVDHVQGLKKASELLPTAQVLGHEETSRLLREGDRIVTYAEISAQNISLEMPSVEIDRTIGEADVIELGSLRIEVWNTPGHTAGQLSFRMDELLFSADNIYRDGCVGNIDAHHGSNIPDFINSLKRIRDSGVKWLLPSHGPIFRNDGPLLDSTIERIQGYQHMADFGTCAVDWPLMDEWEQELLRGFDAKKA